VTLFYFNAEEIFLLEPKGEGEKELGRLLLFNPFLVLRDGRAKFLEPNNADIL
jgi:hypothetical protein